MFIVLHDPSLTDVPIPLRHWRGHAQVAFLLQRSDSLNNRFNPIPQLRTKAVFVTDEDVRVPIDEVVFAFRTWETLFDGTRLVGFYPRSHTELQQGADGGGAANGPLENGGVHQYRYQYHLGLKPPDKGYSMVLTKGMFMASDYLFTYSCLLPQGIRDYVDRVTNCEDLAVNMMVAGMTDEAPLYIGLLHGGLLVDYGTHLNDTMSGISAKAGHGDSRSACLCDLGELWHERGSSKFGKIPLQWGNLMVTRSSWRVRVAHAVFENRPPPCPPPPPPPPADPAAVARR